MSFSIGCNKGSDDKPTPSVVVNNGVTIADGNGTCTQEMIDIHNNVIHSYTDEETTANCDKFRRTIGTFTCKAQKLSTQEAYTMDSRSLESYCAAKPLKTADQTPSYTDPYDSSNNNSNKYQGQSPQCSVAVLTEVNTWSLTSNKFSNSASPEDLLAMVESCHRLKTLTGGNSCYIGQTELNYQKLFGKVCDKADKAVPAANELNTLTPPTHNPNAVSNLPADVFTTKSKITLVGLQPINFTKLLVARRIVLLQNGSIVSSQDLLEDGPVCAIEGLTEFKSLVAKKDIEFNRVTLISNSGLTQLLSDDSKIVISCGLNRKAYSYKYSAQDELDFKLSLKDLKATLDKWFKVVKADL